MISRLVPNLRTVLTPGNPHWRHGYGVVKPFRLHVGSSRSSRSLLAEIGKVTGSCGDEVEEDAAPVPVVVN